MAAVWSLRGSHSVPESRHCVCCSLRRGLRRLPELLSSPRSAAGSLLPSPLPAGGGWGSSGDCCLSPFLLSLKHDQVLQCPCGALCVELALHALCGLLPALLPTCLLASFLCLPSGMVQAVPRPWFVLEVTVCPFSLSLCQFPFCCGDESRRCHHVVLQRKGRAELLTVTGSTALGAATSSDGSAHQRAGARPPSSVSHLTGLPRTVYGGISFGLPWDWRSSL